VATYPSATEQNGAWRRVAPPRRSWGRFRTADSRPTAGPVVTWSLPWT